MSHFTVGVLVDKNGRSLEELLAPYQENNMRDCPKKYLEFQDCTEEVLNDFEEHKEEYSDLSTFAEEYHGYEKNEDRYGYWENPNAQWDWYEVGGRWNKMLLKKDGVKVNYAMLKDIDWELIKAKKKERAEKIWNSNPQGIERYFSGIEKNDTKESFMKRESEFTTYAVITPDGKWHSKGEMGWFGISSESEEDANKWADNFYDAFIKNADLELILVIVDCHI